MAQVLSSLEYLTLSIQNGFESLASSPMRNNCDRQEKNKKKDQGFKIETKKEEQSGEDDFDSYLGSYEDILKKVRNNVIKNFLHSLIKNLFLNIF